MKFSLLLFMSLCILSCSSTTSNPKDYASFLNAPASETVKAATLRLNFWNSKIKEDSLQLVALPKAAEAYGSLFQSTADIQYLKAAEKTLHRAANIAAIDKSGHLEALAANYIKQHRFQEAHTILTEAYEIGGETESTTFMLFDVHMELGNYTEAKTYLDLTRDFKDFNFLTRLAKWEDHSGNLDATIYYMEEAKSIAEGSNTKNIRIWLYTNLADYYGHAGRLKESYSHYLKALKLDHHNAYAKKGIAWIAYSHEGNAVEALRILNSIPIENYSPDYYLLKAEIAEFMGDQITKKEQQSLYTTVVSNPAYGSMYNIPNALLLAEENDDYETALHLAEKEVSARATPETYSVLAHILRLKGDPKKALEISEKYVAGKTFEPEANYRLAAVYKANNKKEKMGTLEVNLRESQFELGPIMARSIEQLYQ
jgi:tetratricopeptide (TPR) repeat protein